MFRSFLIMLIAFLPVPLKAQIQESDKPMLEIRRLIYDIPEATYIGFKRKSQMGDQIEIALVSVTYGIFFKRNNDFYEENLKETLERAFVHLGYPVKGFGNIFTELQSSQTPDFAIGLVVDSVAFNYNSNGLFDLITQFHSKTFVTVRVLNLNIDKIVLDTSLVSEYYSQDIGYSSSTGNFRNFFNGTLEQIAREVSENKQFKAALEGFAESKNTLIAGDTIYLNPNKEALDKTTELKNAIESTVTIKSGNAYGSGVVISSDGLILTCSHVVKDKEDVQIILSNHMEATGKVLRQNPEYDVALVKMENITTRPVKLGNELFPEPMETVWVIGTPGTTNLSQSISRGVVSGIRTIEGKEYIQTDASISPGNSGGPMLNDMGQVIGVVNAKVVGKGVEGLGFAIPVPVALKKLNVVVR